LARISDAAGIESVQKLASWDVNAFRNVAFNPRIPALLPAQTEKSESWGKRWFIKGRITTGNANAVGEESLDYDYWAPFEDAMVPLELTITLPDGSSTFSRSHASLGIFLEWTKHAHDDRSKQLYLAQCPLADLPPTLKNDLPTPDLVLKAGKGDIYDSNLWMGISPTYTPLHRDPNPNLFMQLAGQKVVMLYPPEVGKQIFADVQERIGKGGSSVFRGEEMMQGEEKTLLEEHVWGRTPNHSNSRERYEATLSTGEALFIPLGWWHSIKGIGSGLTASVNWWFR
jgi:hypothetical protein